MITGIVLIFNKNTQLINDEICGFKEKKNTHIIRRGANFDGFIKKK